MKSNNLLGGVVTAAMAGAFAAIAIKMLDLNPAISGAIGGAVGGALGAVACVIAVAVKGDDKTDGGDKG